MTPTLQLQPSYRYPGDEISWAGECPWTGGICFGTDEGNLVVPDFVPNRKEARSLSINRDTVNGLAFGDEFVVASSPTEVTYVPHDGELRVLYAGGAHDLVALSPTLFLGSLGPYGLLSLIRARDRWRVGIGAVKTEETYIYRLCPLREVVGRHIVIGAGRTKGLILYECDNEGRDSKLSYRDFPGHDLVDVCGLQVPENLDAAVALSSNRTLFVTRDVRNELPTQLTVANLEGTGYSVKAVGGHLALLTSKALYVLENFSERLANGEFQAPSRSPVYTLPVEASDFYVVYDEYVLLETKGEIHTLNIVDLVKFGRNPKSKRKATSRSNRGGHARRRESDHIKADASTFSEFETISTPVSPTESSIRQLETSFQVNALVA